VLSTLKQARRVFVRKVVVTEIEAKSALNKLKRKVPYGWDLNIYRGCRHGCCYCYALYSHQYLGAEQFSREIFVKTNIVEVLEKELQAPGWQGDVINIGGVTDSYQPAEAEYQLMPQILKLLIKYKNPAIISTKSDLVLRDYDLISELSRLTYINIAATITTVDEGVREKIEPEAATAAKRFMMLKEFSKTNASTGLHLMPIIPLLTDSAENLEALCRQASDSQVDYLLPGTLYLRGKTRSAFFEFIKTEYPDKLAALQAIYQTGAAENSYKTELYKVLNAYRDQYNLSGSYMKPMREKLK
jgi:DNA repair photolyase